MLKKREREREILNDLINRITTLFKWIYKLILDINVVDQKWCNWHAYMHIIVPNDVIMM